MSETKVCSKCKEEKSLSEFNKSSRDLKRGHAGFRSECRSCNKIERSKNSEKISERGKLYRLNNKAAIAEKDYIRQKSYRRKDPEKYKCKSHEHYIKNKDYISERISRYIRTPEGRASVARKNNNRRARTDKVKNTLTSKQWDKILQMQKNTCPDCGREFSKSLSPTRDHIIPISLGGGLTFGNTRAVCSSCNSRKRNATYFHIPLSRLLV